MTTLADGLGTIWAVRRAYGVRGVALRARHEIRKKFASYSSAPRLSVPAGRGASPFALDLGAVGASVSAEAIERANRVRSGAYQAFGFAWHGIPTGAAWQVHPLSGARYPDVPWFRIRHVDPSVGDIKDAWEPARFGWCYDLIRGYAATRDPSFANAFWMHAEDFFASNPAFRGVQWSCGQETAIRSVALLWAETAFARCAKPRQHALLEEAIFRSGERIADALGYALSQRNNHGLWEAAGLAAVGARFLSTSRIGRTWVRRGLKEFSRAVRDQLAPDGWYIQHSLTYTRVALQAAVVAQLAARAAGERIPGDVVGRVHAAGRLVAVLHDPVSGDVPNHGANDGANPLPLSGAAYRDFRPAVTAVSAALGFAVAAPFVPDGTVEAWLGTRANVSGERLSLAQGRSGWVAARRGRAFVFARAGEYASRPGHLDPLHVDVWFDGRPVAIDAGTYRYSALPPWNDGLRATAVHNTIDVPAHPIARRGPGFLWVGAPVAKIVKAVEDGDATVVVLRNDSWARRGLVHERTIELRATAILVTDVVRGPPGTGVSLHWLTSPGEPLPEVTADTVLATRQTSGDPASVTGWRSLHYGAKDAVVSTTHAFRMPATGVATLWSSLRARSNPSSDT